MTQMKNLWETVRAWCMDPVVRQRAALERAEQKGMARMMEPLRRALREADALGIQFYGERLEAYKRVLNTVSPVLSTLPLEESRPTSVVPLPAPPPNPPPGMRSYIVSSATLAQAYAHLTRPHPNGGPEPEWMLAVTGIKQGELRTLEHLFNVKLSNQSAVTAAFDMQDFASNAITLHEHGQALHAIFHNHPFAGQPTPSAVDWRLQDVLDKGGYPAIQAVFSSDGYIRFFAHCPFTLTVFGKGVECVDPEAFLYRLVHFSTLPHPGDATPAKRAGDALRPVSAHSRR
jgi:hypothetical protein